MSSFPETIECPKCGRVLEMSEPVVSPKDPLLQCASAACIPCDDRYTLAEDIEFVYYDDN